MFMPQLLDERRRTALLAAGMAMVACAVMTSCGSSSSESSAAGSPSAATTTAPRASFDPPKTFGTQAAAKIAIPDPQNWSRECALADSDLKCTSRRGWMSALDPASGTAAWKVSSTLTPVEVSPSPNYGVVSAPVTQGTTVVGAFAGVVAAVGTAPAQDAIEVVAVDTTTGKLAWNAVLNIGASPQDGRRAMADIPAVSVVGVTDTSVVVGASLGWKKRSTWVLDRATHQVKWQNNDFLAKYVGGDTVIGEAPGTPDMLGSVGVARKGLALADGHDRWTTEMRGNETAYLAPSVSNAVFVVSYKKFAVLDPTTGTAMYSIDDPDANGTGAGLGMTTTWKCYYDNRQTVTCQNKSQVAGFDLSNLTTPAWGFRADSHRVPPTITAAYHGVLYGLNTSNQPIMLDATTGKDLPGNPGIAPAMVNRSYGIVSTPVPLSINETNGIVYRATS
ncbi:hypothetical protein ACTWPB_07825 [Nocardia sp. IBHARD005]|uniref:hypothetical protein n=1 Tax=Nocardia sp. IBHARD005 TaxID=3457765 RepID=UPI00405A2AC6